MGCFTSIPSIQPLNAPVISEKAKKTFCWCICKAYESEKQGDVSLQAEEVKTCSHQGCIIIGTGFWTADVAGKTILPSGHLRYCRQYFMQSKKAFYPQTAKQKYPPVKQLTGPPFLLFYCRFLNHGLLILQKRFPKGQKITYNLAPASPPTL